MLRATLPAEFGGCTLEPLEFFDVIEELATADASTAWVTFITNGMKYVSLSRLSPEGLEQVLADGPDVIVSGVTAPRGEARPVEGGYRLSGRWAYSSGCLHADWLVAGAAVRPESSTQPPEVRRFLVPVSEAVLFDNWDPIGLRGTGSNDFQLDNVFVPGAMSFALTDPAHPLFPKFGIDRGASAATAVGIARAAIATVLGLTVRVRGGAATGGPPLNANHIVRYRLAEAQGLVGSGRAFLRETIRDLETTVAAGRDPSAADEANSFEISTPPQATLRTAPRCS